MTAKVSVITPIYNREQWVENLLCNLQKQTLKEIEFIIIDDGSADKTYEILKEKVGGDKRFYLIKSPENKGPSHARNIGLVQARGEYVGFFDCDDAIPSDYFASLYHQAKAQNADIVYAAYNNLLHRIGQIKAPQDKYRVLKNGAIWDKLYRKKYLNTHHIRFTEGLYTADNLFVLQAFMQTDNIILVDTPNYEYTIQEDSIGKDTAKQKKRKKDIVEVLKRALKLKEEAHLSGDEQTEYLQFLQRSLRDYQADKRFQKRFYQTLGLRNEPEKENTMNLAAWHNKPINHTIVAQKGNVFYIKINWKKYIKPLSMVEKSIVWIICFVMLASVWLILFSDKKHLGLSLAVTVLLTMFSLNCIRENNLNVDFYAFVIIATAYFLVTYKLLKYLSRFKIEQHHSRIDIVFLVTFFILLFVPMLHISDAEKSEQENRMLAKYTPLIDYRGGGNLKYGKDFDAWFSDRFWGREKVIQWVNSVQYKISSVYSNNKALYLKKHGWMFVFPIVEIPFSEEKTKEINDNIQKFDAFLAEHGIKFYILIVPRKESIYQTELVDYSYDKQEDIKFQQSIQNIITANNTVPIIYPYDEMRKAKQKDYVFFKQSHHWTDWGAYQGYVKLMERIKKDFSDITVATLDKYEVSYSPKIRDEWKRNYHNGNTTYLLNLNTYADEILTTEYAYYDNKDNSSVKEIREKYIKRFSNENGKYKIFLTGNSHNENLLQFLPYSAKEVKYLRLNNSQLPNKELYKFMKYYKKELLEFKPDIVIFSVSSDILPRITDFFKD